MKNISFHHLFTSTQITAVKHIVKLSLLWAFSITTWGKRYLISQFI